MKKLTLILLLIFIVQNCFSQKIKDDYKMLDNISLNGKIYSVKTKSDAFGFTLKICTKDTCHITQPFSKTIVPSMLSVGIINFITTEFDPSITSNSVSDAETSHIENLIKKIEKQEFNTLEAEKTDLQRTLDEIDRGKKQFSGLLILNKKVPYKIKNNKENVTSTDSLKIIDAKINFFNNKASSIYIKAELLRISANLKDTIVEKLIFLNNRSSVALRYFNYYGRTVHTENANRDEISIEYNDVFDYESDQFFNYSVANSQISLTTDNEESMSSKVLQRRFFDFFTAIIYSDVLGVNTENSNSLLNAQAKLLLPLNLRNYDIFTPIRQFTTTTNIALSNSFEDETRFISIKDDETFSNFDLLKKNNLYGKLALQAITIEYQRLFLNVSLGYSAAFYRTGFKYTQTVTDGVDIITNRQLLSLGHGPFLNFEIRPQTNFGADIILSLEDFNYRDVNEISGRNFKNDIIEDGGKSHFGVKHNLINVEANFYWLTNPEKSKGGIYAKIGTYYHTQSKNIFPQIMVGYATNLSAFVNHFNKKPETGKTQDNN